MWTSFDVHSTNLNFFIWGPKEKNNVEVCASANKMPETKFLSKTETVHIFFFPFRVQESSDHQDLVPDDLRQS